MGVTWNANYELTPLGQDSPTGADEEIRLLKDSISKRMANEHETFETDNSSGAEGDDFVHKAGSGKIYYQSEEPTLRPDGVTSLDSEDTGRLWVDSDTDILYFWNGTAWVVASTDTISTAITFEDTATFEGDVSFKSDVSFEGNVVQSWGKQGILSRPATTAGTTSILWRVDSQIDTTVTGDEQTINSFTCSQAISAGSGITISWETEDHVNGDHWRRLKKNGVTLAENTNNAGFSAISVNTTINPNDVISWVIDASSSLGYVSSRYARITVNESITLTAWEKAYFGLTG